MRHHHATLPDGARVLIRPIVPEDRHALAAGFERLSPESRYRRFFTPMKELAPGELDRLTCVDHHDHEALVALDEASAEGIGAARYVRTGPEQYRRPRGRAARPARDPARGRGRNAHPWPLAARAAAAALEA